MRASPKLVRRVLEKHGGEMSAAHIFRVTGHPAYLLQSYVDGINVATRWERSPSGRGPKFLVFYVPSHS